MISRATTKSRSLFVMAGHLLSARTEEWPYSRCGLGQQVSQGLPPPGRPWCPGAPRLDQGAVNTTTPATAKGRCRPGLTLIYVEEVPSV